ncbi:guanylate kinase 1-like isoform X2 [Carex littledalei]|uniref:Guanylate kinase 1-like isoform X2 n=1 Tax=Carex littledalei TaxID=544730 RepID=A0A833QLZ1_9POAL|nr:guanylate kinase 1-like isoform X2 [Carex littledalei]
MAENVEPLWGELLEAPAPIETKAPTFLFRNFFNLSTQQNHQKGPKEADLVRVSPKLKRTAEKRLSDKEFDITLVPPKKQKRLPFKEMLNFVLDDDLKKQSDKRSKSTEPVPAIPSDYLMCTQYAVEIYKNYGVVQHEKRAVWGYMKNLQSDLTPKMRAMLVDWMVQSKLEREKLVVLGTSCILIASKYEERRRPTSTVAQLFTHTKCTKAEVLSMETKVLSTVGYDISVPTINTFLSRYLQFTEASPQAQPNLELVARYLAELTLLDYNFLRYLPSEIAASAVFLAKWALDPSSHPWNENLRVQTGYHSKDLKICVQNLKKFQKNIKRSDYNTIYVKFQRKKVQRSHSEKITYFFMGQEIPESFTSSLIEDLSVCSGGDADFKGHKTVTEICGKLYVIGALSEEADSRLNVKIFDKSTRKWSAPTILGKKPKASKFHSAVLVTNDHILILTGDSSANEFSYFLEVDTNFVRERKELLGGEVVAWSKGSIGEGPIPIVISGPSGVGKGTLINKLMKDFPSTFGFSVSHTTRAPREKEVNGVHYHFTKREVMETDIKEGKFLESALRCILDIDVQGARLVRARTIEAIFIFIRPPSFEELEKRLRDRGTETEEQVQKRLRNAKKEMEEGKEGLFDHVLVNDDLESCYTNLKKLLGLDDDIQTSNRAASVDFKTPSSFTISRDADKIFIESQYTETKDGIPKRIVLDVSSLKGGAPGRTRGLAVSAEY